MFALVSTHLCTDPPSSNSTHSHGSLHKVTRGRPYHYVHCTIIPQTLHAQILRKSIIKRKKPNSVPPSQETITRILENRDKDSKLPVEEDAGIHSNQHHTMEVLHHVSSALKGSWFSSHAKPWLRSRENTACSTSQNVSHMRGGVQDEPPCGSSME